MTERDRKKALRALRQCWRVYSAASRDRGSRRVLRAIEEAGKAVANVVPEDSRRQAD